MFVDVTHITVQAGQGGHGAVSFHREKYVAAGGPDGGDGGRGGHIYIKADPHMATLMDFRYKRRFTAENGQNGSGGRRSGKDGADVTIRVPKGTLVRDKATGALLWDLSTDEPFLCAKGGRGGWGNAHFATPTRQCPRFAKAGADGVAMEITLELKLLADVGLVGLPNAGKSSLLAALSSARPKIADYAFTTLTPNLGVVAVDARTSFVMADLPGLIEGAHEGAGLGGAFLRHAERCRLLLHVVDAGGFSEKTPEDAFATIQAELSLHSPELKALPQIIVANKCDLNPEPEMLDGLRQAVAPAMVYAVSAATGEGLQELTRAAAALLATLPPVKIYEPDYIPPEPEAADRTFSVRRNNEDWLVEGDFLEAIIRDVNFSDYESRMYFDRVLKKAGVFEELERRGVSDGDTVRVYDLEFEYRR